MLFGATKKKYISFKLNYNQVGGTHH